jgi:hypothetical protein
MSPLIGIAINMLPELAKRLAPGSSKETRDMVIGIVRDVLDTDDPEEAARRAQDSQLSAELRIRLAEIEAAAEAREAEAQAADRRAELDRFRAELAAAADQRAADLKRFEARLADQQNARSTMVDLEREESPLAWGPVVVSTIVVIGFFAALIYLIQGGFEGREPNAVVFQVVNIAVGALTAGFATVVSFWLGSSDGSRRKDLSAVQTQSTVARMQRENALATRDMVSEQSRQTVALIEKVAQQAPVSAPPPAVAAAAPTPPAGKDARQFMRCVEIILRHEGGYVDHPDDPGGATNLGITHKTLAAWRGEPVTRDDVRNLDHDEACEIYRANYWNALNCDNLPAGVDLVVFDMGVNAGPSRAAKMLQKIVHVEQDGQVGPITFGAVKSIDASFIVAAFSDARLDYYRSLKHWGTFGRGWTRRTTETRAAALEML